MLVPRPSARVVDELGCLPMGFAEWAQVFADPVVASAALGMPWRPSTTDVRVESRDPAVPGWSQVAVGWSRQA
jgi:hypothetical protein